jgi:hypothetical protein
MLARQLLCREPWDGRLDSKFLALALQLAMLLDEIKAASFKVQLLRQIVYGNPIAILLCVRSLIEHNAVVKWLVKRLDSQWEEIGKRVKPAEKLPPHAGKLEEIHGRSSYSRPW